MMRLYGKTQTEEETGCSARQKNESRLSITSFSVRAPLKTRKITRHCGNWVISIPKNHRQPHKFMRKPLAPVGEFQLFWLILPEIISMV